MSDINTNKINKIEGWKTSSQGRPINLFHSRAFSWDSKKRPLLWLGGVHGDEPEGVHLCNTTLNFLRQHEGDIHDRLPWVLIPCLNPDGLEQLNRVNGNGVDLNRNFPSSDWSPEHSKPRYYPGDRPASEPEVAALVELIEQINPFLIVHCHAYEPSLTYTGEPARPYAEWLNMGVDYVIQPDIGYPTPGSLGQYGWLDRKTPVICVEVEEGSDREKVESTFLKGVENFFSQVSRNY